MSRAMRLAEIEHELEMQELQSWVGDYPVEDIRWLVERVKELEDACTRKCESL